MTDADAAPARPPAPGPPEAAPFRREVLDIRRHPDSYGRPLESAPAGLGRMTAAAARAIGAVAAAAVRNHARRAALRHFPQTEAADCGPACLATTLTYFGRDVTLKQLRALIDTGRGGTSAGALLRAARGHGLIARGVQTDVAGLRLLPRAAILHWNLGHFVVLDEVTRHGVVVVDPAAGRRTVPFADVERSFTGVALVFEGERVARRGPVAKERRRHWEHLLPLVKDARLWRSIVIAALLGQLLVLSFPLLLRYVVDHVIAVDRPSVVQVIALLVVPMFGVQLLVLGVRAVSLSWLRSRVDFRLTLATFNKMLSLPYPFLARRTTGDLLLRVRSTTALRQVFTTTVLSGIVDGATAVTLLVVVAYLDPRLGLLAAGMTGLQAVTLMLAWRHQRELTVAGLEAQAASQGRLVELLSGVHTVKVAGAEAAAADAWAQLLTEETNWEARRSIAAGVTEGLLQSLRLVTPVVLLVAGTTSVLRGEVTTGSMIGAVSLAIGATVPVTAMMTSLFQMAMVRGHLDRLNDVFDEESERETGVEPPSEGGRLVARGLAFTYPGAPAPVIRDVGLTVEPRASLAVMGPSGSGKSTLAMLLAGMLTPDAGTVELDGADIAALAVHRLREHIAVVPQHPHFFGGTIRDNITVFRDFPTEDVERAARLACLHDEIAQRPMGYDSVVAERGESLSGGQLQRIGLARVLIGRPRVLILDEATSALDPATEQRVIDNVLGLGITCVFITHRESLAARAAAVVRVEQGRVREAAAT